MAGHRAAPGGWRGQSDGPHPPFTGAMAKSSTLLENRALVTGGSGFLGSHLCDRLIERGHDVLCIDNLFTGQTRNVSHLLAHPRFEFTRRSAASRRPGLAGLAHFMLVNARE